MAESAKAEVYPIHTSGTGEVDPTLTSGGGKGNLKPLLVKPATHGVVAEAARRLDRSMDTIVQAAMILLNRETAGQQVERDEVWIKGFGGGQS